MPLIPPLVDLTGLGASLETVNKDFQNQLSQIIHFGESFIDDFFYNLQSLLIKIISTIELTVVCGTTALLIFMTLYPEAIGQALSSIKGTVGTGFDKLAALIPKLNANVVGI